ncbi:uncharacterized protein LOC124634571 [Helicoverpa zea]|uniref:uncharacterized protein LOC124634571 n=1 Tax=Helicoverpa zea TaxID=7113 RepID=UPI001F57B706|nr:uncharacterized protein LOC124634571 [Helicoverpa zea]
MNWYIFGFLPRVEFYCISLKQCCILIAIVYFFYGLEAILSNELNVVYGKCIFTGILLDMMICLARIVCTVMCIAAFVFLFGIIKKNRDVYLAIMHLTMVVVLLNLCGFFLLVVTRDNNCNKNCPMRYYFAALCLFWTALLFFFLVVINSQYRSEIMNRVTVTPPASTDNDVIEDR